MLCRKPVLLATSPQGKERRAEEEIGNTLFPYDPNISVMHAGFPGVLLVCSDTLSPDKAYVLLRTRYQAYVRKVVPCHLVLEQGSMDRLVEDVWKLVAGKVSMNESIRIECTSRGYRLQCSKLKEMIASRLRSMGYRVNWKKYTWLLSVESVGSLVIAGLKKIKSRNH